MASQSRGQGIPALPGNYTTINGQLYTEINGQLYPANPDGSPNGQPAISANAAGQQNPTAPAGQAPPSGAAAPGSAAPVNTGTAAAPYGTSTIGYNGNQGLSGTQQPGIFGTGTFVANPYAINDSSITGAPANPDGNYGLNNVMQTLQNATSGLGVQNYNATAPIAQAAQGTAAQGSAAQGAAAQMAASGYGAAQGNASSYQGAMGQASGYGAAQGTTAAGVNQVSGQASLAGSPALAGAAQLGGGAQSGYATAGPTSLSAQGYAQAAGQQQNLANILGTQAAGGGVSPADLQLQQGTQQQIASQLAVLGSQRGGAGNAALTARSAADQAAASQQALNQNMGIQRAQETLNAQQSLGTVLGTMGSQAQNQNINQATLNQQTALANQGAAQGATLQNSAQQQQALLANLGMAQQSGLANQSALNANSQFNAGQMQSMTGLNLNNAQAANMYNASNSQQLQLANLAAQNQAAQYNAGNAQGMSLANQSSLNAANSQNAQLAQAMTGLNLGSQNAAASQNAQQQQAAAAANQGALNTMTSQNLNAQNSFGLQNLTNAQQTALSNTSNAQQTNLANQAQLGQTGLANQGTALAAQNQYNAQLNALLGAQTGVGEANKSASLADQQLQVQQQIAANQVNAQAFAASAAANAGLTGAALSGVGSVIGAGINAAAAGGGSSAGGGGATSTVDPGAGADIAASQGLVPANNPNLVALSDENVKEGIDGGNPMLASFLDQYHDFSTKEPSVDPTVGENFHLTRTGGTSPQTSVGAGAQVAGSIAGLIPFVGGMFASGISRLGSTTTPGSGGAVQASGIDSGDSTQGDLSPDWSKLGMGNMGSLSDENEKQAVTSGNQGMQAFLEQANAQQKAGVSQGASNNAFMQQGQAPTSQVNTQLPAYLAGQAPAAYGQAQGQAPGFSGASGSGQVQGPGGSMGGSAYGGAYTPGSSYSGYNGQSATMFPGGLSGMGGYGPGGLAQNASVMSGGVTAPGGVTQGAGMSSMGGTYAGGIMNPDSGFTAGASGPNPMAQATMTPIQQGFAAQNALNYANPVGPNVMPASSITNAASPTIPVNPMVATSSQNPISGGFLGMNTLSDEREKEELPAFLDAVHAHQYRYKNPDAPGAGQGTFVSPMAQELEKTDLGKSAVQNTPDGTKMVDYGKLGGTMLAGLAYHQERLNDLEKLLRGSP